MARPAIESLNGGWRCLDCPAPVAPSRSGVAHRCAPCRDTHNHGMRLLSGAAAAHTAVARAVRKGELPLAKSCQCADCGRVAEQYDHRDYARPLDVQPVCRSCNFKRGPAKWLKQAEAA